MYGLNILGVLRLRVCVHARFAQDDKLNAASKIAASIGLFASLALCPILNVLLEMLPKTINRCHPKRSNAAVFNVIVLHCHPERRASERSDARASRRTPKVLMVTLPFQGVLPKVTGSDIRHE